jgi:hypothetical protein
MHKAALASIVLGSLGSFALAGVFSAMASIIGAG